MDAEEQLRERLVARQQQAARIAAGVRHAQQFEITGDVRLVDGDVLELHQQVEHDVRLEAFDVLLDRRQIVRDAEHQHLVTELAQAAADVVLLAPGRDVLLALAFERVGRHQVDVREHEHAQRLHRRNSPRSRARPSRALLRA